MTSRLARTVATVAVAALVALGASAAPAHAAGSQLPPPTDNAFGGAAIHWLMNHERMARGLAPVHRNEAADIIAQFSANVQAWFGALGHNPNLARDVTKAVTPNWRFVGENVGCAANAPRLHTLWLRSPHHADNMLHRNVDTVGIGYTYARGCAWATVVFIGT